MHNILNVPTKYSTKLVFDWFKGVLCMYLIIRGDF